MPDDIKKAEEEIGKSTGNTTEKYAKDLEDDVDNLINDVYHNEEDKDDGDKDDKDDEADGDTDDDKDTDDNSDEAGEEADVDDKEDKEDKEEKEASDDDDITKQLENAQKRVKDTRKEFTKKSQELADTNKKVSGLEDTVFSLRTKVEELTNAQQTKSEEKKAEKEIEKDKVVLTDKLEAIRKVDPDMAAALEPIVGGLISEVNTLRTEIKSSKAESEAVLAKDKEDAHFAKIDKAHDGWEDTMRSDDFKEYLQELPPRDKRLALMDLKAGSADQIIEVFDDFNKSQNTGDDGLTAEERKEAKLKKAKNMSGPKNNKSKEINRGVTTFKYTRSEINAMKPKEYAEKEAEIDKAWVAGQIDISR